LSKKRIDKKRKKYHRKQKNRNKSEQKSTKVNKRNDSPFALILFGWYTLRHSEFFQKSFFGEKDNRNQDSVSESSRAWIRVSGVSPRESL
jgi:hypothetical protein